LPGFDAGDAGPGLVSLYGRASSRKGDLLKKVAIFVLAGVLAFGLLGPAAAKKKKPKKPPALAPVEVQFFLRADTDCPEAYLSTTAGSEDDWCYYGLNDTFNETGPEAVSGDPVDHYVAVDGVPLTLDPTRKVTGSLTISGWAGTGVGNAELDVALLATIGGEEKTLGTFAESYSGEPNTNHVAAFEIEIDPALAGAVVESLTLDVHSHGMTVFGRGAEHNGQSWIKVPALQ
jgi:hypothetical protein